MGPIYVMWLRQLKRYWRSKSRMIASLGQPLIFLLAFGFGFGPIFQRAGSGNYIQFLAPGIIAMSTLSSAMFMGIELIWDRQFGFLKETLVAPVSRYQIMLGRTLGGATVSMIQGIIVLIISMAVGFRPYSLLMLPLAFLFMFLIAVLFTALGTSIATFMEDMHAFPLITNFLVMPMVFLSGAIFPIDNLPPAVKLISNLNPLTYGVDALRGALTGAHLYSQQLSAGIIVAMVFVVYVIGSYMFSKIQL